MCVCVSMCVSSIPPQLLVAEDCITVHHTTQHMDTSNVFSQPVVQVTSTGKHLCRVCGGGGGGGRAQVDHLVLPFLPFCRGSIQ